MDETKGETSTRLSDELIAKLPRTYSTVGKEYLSSFTKTKRFGKYLLHLPEEDIDCNFSRKVVSAIWQDTPLLKQLEKEGKNRINFSQAKTFSDSLQHYFKTLIISQAKKAWKEEYLLAGETPDNDDLVGLKDEAQLSAEARVEEWFSDLKARKVPVSEGKLTIPSQNLEIHYSKIGDDSLDIHHWEMIFEAARFFLTIKDKLKIETKGISQINIFELQDLAKSTNPLFLVDRLSDETESLGFRTPNIPNIIVLPYAEVKTGQDATFSVLLRRNDLQQSINHEISHLIDPFFKQGTDATTEGFANMCRFDFSYEKAKMNLKYNYSFHFNTDLDQLKSVYTNQATTDFESYGISPAFFCYLFEKMGPESFMRFYGLIVGDSSFPEAKGNLSTALTKAEENNPGFDSETFLLNFLYDLNFGQ